MNGHAAAVAARGANTIRKLASAVETLESQLSEANAKIAAYERRDRVHDIARQMEDRGVNPEMSLDQKVASINHHCKTAAAFDTLETAVKMAGAGRVELAEVDDDTPGPTSSSADSWHNFLVSGYSG